MAVIVYWKRNERGNMYAKCPKDKSHETFTTSAHVQQVWEVDKTGDWISTVDDCVEVAEEPTFENVWYCATCHSKAVFVDDEK